MTGEAGYVAFKTCTPIFHQLLQEINNDRTSDLRILDVGAGTGLVGSFLRDHGYSNIDALDISQKMLDEAKKLNIYKDMFCVALGEKPIPGIENDQYDAAICVGTLTVGHVKPVALDEIVRIVKPGERIVFKIPYAWRIILGFETCSSVIHSCNGDSLTTEISLVDWETACMWFTAFLGYDNDFDLNESHNREYKICLFPFKLFKKKIKETEEQSEKY